MAGLGVGVFAVLATLGGFAVGYGGVDAVQAVSTSGNAASGPYTDADLPLPSVGTVGVSALVVGGLLALLGVAVGGEV